MFNFITVALYGMEINFTAKLLIICCLKAAQHKISSCIHCVKNDNKSMTLAKNF